MISPHTHSHSHLTLTLLSLLPHLTLILPHSHLTSPHSYLTLLSLSPYSHSHLTLILPHSHLTLTSPHLTLTSLLPHSYLTTPPTLLLTVTMAEQNQEQQGQLLELVEVPAPPSTNRKIRKILKHAIRLRVVKFEVEYEDLPGVRLRVLAPKLRGSPEAIRDYLQRLQAMSPRQFGWLIRYLPELPDWAMEEEVV